MINLHAHDFKRAPVDKEELLRRIASGNAVLFVGSGFSRGALSVEGEELPTAAGLAAAIGELGGFDSDGDLRYASERYMRDGDTLKLVELLESRFSVTSQQSFHGQISAAGWRRIYTTNYDLLVERSAEAEAVLIKSVDLEDSVRENSSKNVCVHLNGSLRSLSVAALNNSFKLTNSSYLSADSFLTSGWHFTFKKDLEIAKAIVFVGYSLYDIEIQRFLYQMPEFKEKTYFITHEQESEKQLYTLGLYGQVLPVGAEAFGGMLKESLARYRPEPSVGEILSLIKYELASETPVPRDSDVDKLLMYGSITNELIESAVGNHGGAPILVNRCGLDDARRLIGQGKNLIVVSDFGNGKTLFLRMLASSLAAEGKDVFTVEGSDIANFADLEQLSKRQGRAYLFIDGYEPSIDLIKAFATLNPSNIILIASARTNSHERHRTDLTAAGLEFSEFAVDQLSNWEIEELVQIFDNAGLWGERASLTHARKIDQIASKYRSQISLTLLSALESPQIVQKVAGLLNPLLGTSDYKDTILAIAVLQALDIPLTASLISETALNDAIYRPELRSDLEFRQVFSIEGQRVSTKSSLFALSILRHQFGSAHIVDHLLKVISRFGRDRDPPQEKAIIFKELLRFSNIERLLPEQNKKANMLRYYEELKRRADWLIGNPHFWLQYAMTQMQFDDYAKAQKYLDQAYALAKSRLNYHTLQIDTQQARMWLEQSTKAADSVTAYQFFEKANALLKNVPNDIHKFWQLNRYPDIYQRHYSKFTKGQAAYFEQGCKNAASDIDRAIATHQIPLHLVQRSESIRESLLLVVSKVLATRQVVGSKIG